jgi:hypothetical protein
LTLPASDPGQIVSVNDDVAESDGHVGSMRGNDGLHLANALSATFCCAPPGESAGIDFTHDGE